MLSAAAQLDYTLAGFVFEGIAVPAAVLHIQSVVVNAQGDAIVTVQIYATLAALQANGACVAAQWAYPVTDGQTMAQVWASLCALTGLTTQDGSPVSLSGATPVSGE